MKQLVYIIMIMLSCMSIVSCEKQPDTTQFTGINGFFEYEYPYTRLDDDNNVVKAEGKRRVVINRATARIGESPNRPDLSRRIDFYLYPDYESCVESEATQFIHACLVDSLIDLDVPANAQYKVKELADLMSTPKASICLDLDGTITPATDDSGESYPFVIEKTLDTEFKVLAIYPGTYQIIGNGNVGDYKYQFCYTGPVEVLKD